MRLSEVHIFKGKIPFDLKDPQLLFQDNFSPKKVIEKILLFHQNHGLIPLENMQKKASI